MIGSLCPVFFKEFVLGCVVKRLKNKMCLQIQIFLLLIRMYLRFSILTCVLNEIILVVSIPMYITDPTLVELLFLLKKIYTDKLLTS